LTLFDFTLQVHSVSIPGFCCWSLPISADAAIEVRTIGMFPASHFNQARDSTVCDLFLASASPIPSCGGISRFGTLEHSLYQRDCHSARSITFIDRHVSTFLVPDRPRSEEIVLHPSSSAPGQIKRQFNRSNIDRATCMWRPRWHMRCLRSVLSAVCPAANQRQLRL
jgi:hypothetical protein